MGWNIVFRVLFFAHIFDYWCSVVGYPNGAPAETCNSMMPDHVMPVLGLPYPPQLVDPYHPYPYNITTNLESVESGQIIELKVDVEAGMDFKGFLILARNYHDFNEIIGTFIEANTEPEAKPLACDSKENSAMTHSNNARKTELKLKWLAPLDFQGQVLFVGTIVKSHADYWHNITSTLVSVHPASTESISSTTIRTDYSQEKSFMEKYGLSILLFLLFTFLIIVCAVYGFQFIRSTNRFTEIQIKDKPEPKLDSKC